MTFHWFCFFATSLFIYGKFTLTNATITVVDQHGIKIKTFNDKQALYSAPLIDTYKGLTGLASPPNACKEIKEPDFFYNATILRYVLINGTTSRDCSSVLRAEHAEIAGYDLAIIYGADYWQPTDFIFKIQVNIPVRFVTYIDGITIKENYLFNNKSNEVFFLLVNPIPDDINYYIKLFSIAIGACIVIMLVFVVCLLVKCIQERRRSRRNRLSFRQIRQLPTEVFKQGDAYDVCAICLEDYKEGEKLRILPCSHAYHCVCIDPWLTENRRNCPLCKRKIRFGSSSSSESDAESDITSPAEDTPLISGTERNNLGWGTFEPDITRVPHSPGSSGYYNAVADVAHSDTIASTDGSINSNEENDSLEFRSCNLQQPHRPNSIA